MSEQETVTPTGESPPASLNLIPIRLSWMGNVVECVDAPFHHVRVDPEPAHPKGRKGLVLASAWRQMQTSDDAGMLVLDGDVVIEPTDLNTMVTHVANDREAVWVARAKIWPRSTHLPTWAWGHRKAPESGASEEEIIRLWQTDVDDPDWWTLCFTFLPRRLIEEATRVGLKTWHYPNVDKNLHELAKKLGIRARVVRGDCWPKHLHF